MVACGESRAGNLWRSIVDPQPCLLGCLEKVLVEGMVEVRITKLTSLSFLPGLAVLMRSYSADHLHAPRREDIVTPVLIAHIFHRRCLPRCDCRRLRLPHRA